MEAIGRGILILGLVLVVIGSVFAFFPNLPSIPKLPGDIYIKRDSFTFYFPIVTSIVISIILTLIINFFFRK